MKLMGKITRRFFKVMLPGFHQRLSLPPAISKSLQKVRSRRATLRSRLGTWKVSVCRSFENDLLCFSRGWPQFAERHALNVGDFLVFQIDHTAPHLHLNVVVFDPTACEKEFKEMAKVEATPTTVIAEDRNPHFTKTMAPRHATKRARVNLPIEFVRSNNLGKKRSVVLRDPGGREWAVKLSVEDIGGIRTYLRMRRGWHAFYASNTLRDGDTCVFELVPSSVAHTTTIFLNVQILRA